jgi:hypothetical protein
MGTMGACVETAGGIKTPDEGLIGVAHELNNSGIIRKAMP